MLIRRARRDPEHFLVALLCDKEIVVIVRERERSVEFRGHVVQVIGLGRRVGRLDRRDGRRADRSRRKPFVGIGVIGTVDVQVVGGQRITVVSRSEVPFVKLLAKDAASLAKRRGYVKTILGRRCNFPDGKFTHKAANRIIQGSSADMVKKALVDLDAAGYLPYNTVHDEVDNPIESIEDCYAIRDIMLNAIPLKVPLLVDIEVGPNWGNCTLIGD